MAKLSSRNQTFMSRWHVLQTHSCRAGLPWCWRRLLSVQASAACLSTGSDHTLQVTSHRRSDLHQQCQTGASRITYRARGRKRVWRPHTAGTVPPGSCCRRSRGNPWGCRFGSEHTGRERRSAGGHTRNMIYLWEETWKLLVCVCVFVHEVLIEGSDFLFLGSG